MISLSLTLVMYQTRTGKRPFEQWYVALGKSMRAIVAQRLARLEGGHFGMVRPIHRGVWELKLNVGPGYRIYYGIDQGQVVLLQACFVVRVGSKFVKF